ncbi:MAG: TRAP transporter small permease subunit [Alphaproteobacteria bacterium]|nr:TRAP transporter small permease subunit [Alphaproteobacteria bacterium]
MDKYFHHTELPNTRLSDALNGFIRRIGEAVSWLWIVLVVVIVTNVTMRYVFGEGRIEFEEIQWHIYSIGFLIGLSYCLEADDHVRVDVLHDRFNLRTQAWVEFFGILLFLLPFIALVLIYSVPYITYSMSLNESSEAPGGLPARWAIKSFMFIGFALLAVSAIARLARVCAFLFGGARAQPPAGSESA